MLNLLIAVMSEAYEDVKDTAEARWCYAQFVEMHKQREQKKAADPTWSMAKEVRQNQERKRMAEDPNYVGDAAGGGTWRPPRLERASGGKEAAAARRPRQCCGVRE